LLLVTQTGDTGDIGDITGPGPVPVNIRALVQGNWAVNFLITTLFTMLRVSGLKRMPLLGAHAAYRIALSCSKTRHTSLIGAGAIALSEAQASSWQRYKCSWACCEVAWSRGVVQSCSRAVVQSWTTSLREKSPSCGLKKRIGCSDLRSTSCLSRLCLFVSSHRQCLETTT
jgi:hypothetical protein